MKFTKAARELLESLPADRRAEVGNYAKAAKVVFMLMPIDTLPESTALAHCWRQRLGWQVTPRWEWDGVTLWCSGCRGIDGTRCGKAHWPEGFALNGRAPEGRQMRLGL